MQSIKINEKYQLFWEEEEDQYHVQFVSNDKQVRAIEFMDYLFENQGEMLGKKNRAFCVIKRTFADVLVLESKTANFEEFLKHKATDYFEKCDWIYSSDFVEQQNEQILTMKKYSKKAVPWAYVKTTDIVPEGDEIYLTSLENESGITLTSSGDIYIMIGCRGEIYHISRENFEKTYTPGTESFDIFMQMASYIPEVKIVSSNEYVCIDRMAKLCYPQKDNFIYARELERRTKVFGLHCKGDYFLGNVGDYLAVRGDDLSDVYIIRRDIFFETYELKD